MLLSPSILYLVSLALERRGLIAVILLAGLMTAAIDAIGITLFIPLLEAGQPSGALAHLPLFSSLMRILADLGPRDQIMFVAASLVVLALLRGVVSYLFRALGEYFQVEIDFRLRCASFEKTMALPVLEIERYGTGKIITIADSIPGTIGSSTHQLIQAAGAAIQVGVYVSLLFWMSPYLAAGAIVAVLGSYLVVKVVVARRLARYSRQMLAALVQVTAAMVEGISAHRVVAAFQLNSVIEDRFRERCESYRSLSRRSRIALAVVDPLFQALIAVIIGGILVAVAVSSHDPRAEIPLALIFMFVLYRLAAPSTQIFQSLNYVSAFDAQISEFRDFMKNDGGAEKLTDGRRDPPEEFKKLVVTDLGYSYRGREAKVLDGVSFEVKRGDVLAILGASGAGKSTLISLLGRFVDPTSGSIAIDDADIRTFRIAAWRRRLGIVAQETRLFDETIRNNLLFVRPSASEDEIWTALSRAGAADFIRAMPDVLDTRVGEYGAQLSGGQRQRIAVARALIAGADILVLDEATSSLDSETERAVSDTVELLRGDVTIVVVSHRVNNVRRADNILVLSDGRIAEQGKHSDLAATSVFYRRMIELQATNGSE